MLNIDFDRIKEQNLKKKIAYGKESEILKYSNQQIIEITNEKFCILFYINSNNNTHANSIKMKLFSIDGKFIKEADEMSRVDSNFRSTKFRNMLLLSVDKNVCMFNEDLFCIQRFYISLNATNYYIRSLLADDSKIYVYFTNQIFNIYDETLRSLRPSILMTRNYIYFLFLMKCI